MFLTFVDNQKDNMEKTLLNIETVTEYDDMLGVETLPSTGQRDRPFKSQTHTPHAAYVQLLCGVPERREELRTGLRSSAVRLSERLGCLSGTGPGHRY